MYRYRFRLRKVILLLSGFQFLLNLAGIEHRSKSRTAAEGSAMTAPDTQVSCSYILGIESSCDDTAVAVLRTSDGAVLGHSIAGQVASYDKCH